ncbi:MAG: heme o synthase [Myxococcota bacterium]
MQVADTVRVSPRPRLADFIALGKPRLSLLVVCTAAAGLWVAPVPLPWWRSILALLATLVLVGSANAFNSYWERESDSVMRRTRRRPLPDERLEPHHALTASIVGALASTGILLATTNVITAVLGSLAFVIYGVVYTPLKARSSMALFVGGIPGAIPPLMGWTAATGQIDLVGLALFGILFLWQLPHFIAISIYLSDDYERGGLKVFSNVHGANVARISVVVTAALLIPVAWSLVPLGVGTSLYGVASIVLGAGFLVATLNGIRGKRLKRWGRQVFLASLVYLTLLLAALAVGSH